MEPFVPGEPAAPIGYYDGTIMFAPRTDHDSMRVNFAWHVRGGKFVVLPPAPPEEENADDENGGKK
jgi:hypothetical protein